jgi:multicomponent Na+:H+ antiporter subunit E
MNLLLLNLFLALTWVFVTGEFTPINLAFGFLLGYLILWFTQRAIGASGYFGKVARIARFAAFYLRELVSANLRVAYDVVTPTHHMRPGIVAIPLDAKTDTEITLLANFITMTPGTLSLDVSDDRKVLYLHAMYLGDMEEFRREIKEGLERRLLEALR